MGDFFFSFMGSNKWFMSILHQELMDPIQSIQLQIKTALSRA